ncbi:type I-E CRISPR-associated protein Cse1/CasA, partial [Streptomyces clavuligerus]
MPAPSASSFPLASSPWLPVLDLDTRAERHVGLTEALTRAHRLRLSLPEQDEPAVLRLLLAVLDAACGPDTPAAWDAAWAAPRLPAGPVTAYLDQWADRLDLFHPEHPVFQCAGLTPNRGAQSLDPVSLSGSGGGFWSDALLAAGPPHPYRPWTPAEAVVRLLWLHAYDVGGIKTAAPGDPAGKGSKVYGALPGPIAQVTHLHLTVRRGTLKDDLLINLPPQPRAPGDAPVWEQDPAPVPVRERTPLGRLDRWTWPARRILLHTGGDGMVTGLALHDGDRLPKNHDDGLIASLDPLTGWQTTAKGRPWPLQVLNPAGFHLPWHTARLLDPHDPQGLASGVVTHAVAAAERGALAADTVIHVSTGTT